MDTLSAVRFTATVAAHSAAEGASFRVTPAVPPRDAALLGLGAVEAVAAMQSGDFTAERYATTLLEQVDRWSVLNAFRMLDRDAVLQAARAADVQRSQGGVLGRLHGLPIPVKDSVNTRMLPTSNGTRLLTDFRPSADASVIGLLGEEGAIVMGKTNLHELSFGWTSNNETFGAVRNPYDIARSPGGSSGGSAAAVSARMAPLAVAEDTWGSIRLPASFCGLAGFRPSRGRYPDDGIMTLSRNFDQVGPLARSVEDLVLFDQIAARDARPIAPRIANEIRIALPAALWADLDPEVERVARRALARLREAGVSVVEIAASMNDVMRAPRVVGTIVAYELRSSVVDFLRRHETGVSFDDLYATLASNTKNLMDSMILPPCAPSREAYEAALFERGKIASIITSRMRAYRVHALAFPVATVRAPLIGEETEVTMDDGRMIDSFDALGRNVALGSCVGMASVVLPAGLATDGMPIGIEFAGLPGGDRGVLALGLALERILGAARESGTEAYRDSRTMQP
ncbi:amidase family protein [Burkholderia ambifaria]|uniref:amidase family protein n=1 Tax=Burkholderia ambifaria TaxID=152480 RepID=UPI0015895244|nr:amidase family protein [Burkholderia ambifaria]